MALGLVAAAEGLGRPVVVALPRADVVLRRDQSIFGPLADVVRQEQTIGLGVRRAEGEEAPDVVRGIGRVRDYNVVRRQALRPEDLIKVLALVVYLLEAQGPQVPRDGARAVVGVVDAEVRSTAAERGRDDVERRREVRVGLGRALAVVVGLGLEGQQGGVPRARVPHVAVALRVRRHDLLPRFFPKSLPARFERGVEGRVARVQAVAERAARAGFELSDERGLGRGERECRCLLLRFFGSFFGLALFLVFCHYADGCVGCLTRCLVYLHISCPEAAWHHS